MIRCFVILALFVGTLLAAPLKEEAYLSPQQAPAKMTMPEGFRVKLIAGEPTLIKPIAMTTDERGRLWVVESHSYPHWITDGKPGKDRVLILEPGKDGEWSCKVFLDNGVNLAGIAVGHGGVWLASVPKITYIPRKNGEDKPAGPEVVHLDGFDLKAKHNVVNGLAWGPDGWLYGCNGILSHAKVGAPGSPADKRVSLDCGVWRYHPTRKVFELVASGTTNPWGIDWDDHGELFLTNCVIKHLFHVVPGAHFVRMFGQDINPNSYDLMTSCADHIHWGGGNWTSSRGGKGVHSVAGGGHAHAGALFYLGDNWPAEYRNRILMCNIHGNRLNQDRIERFGSGYVARHCEDLLLANDPWFRGLGLQMSGDGGVFVSDWHDTGECHNYDKTHPSGRIYKMTYGTPREVITDLSKKSDADLVQLQGHRNDWWVRQARLELAYRAAQGKLSKDVQPSLRRMLDDSKEATGKLRALWALFSIGGAEEKSLLSLLDDKHEAVRVWAVRLLGDENKVSPIALKRLVTSAQKDTSAAVRLALASTLQRLPLQQRWDLAATLAAHEEDAKDANLPLMIWYGVEPAVLKDPSQAVELVKKAKIPLVRRFIARRLAATAE